MYTIRLHDQRAGTCACSHVRTCGGSIGSLWSSSRKRGDWAETGQDGRMTWFLLTSHLASAVAAVELHTLSNGVRRRVVEESS